MKIGIPKEIKPEEFRVSITPGNLLEFIHAGHEIYIEKDAGVGSGFSNHQYEENGAKIIDSHKKVFDSADMILKIKEPLDEEIDLFKDEQILFTYLHLAANEHLTLGLLEKNVIGIAYETVQLDNGRLPLLDPMSEVAGRMAPVLGTYLLSRHKGGIGKLICHLPGLEPGNVVIIGGGTAGKGAALMAAGLGAQVILLEIDDGRIRELTDILPPNVSVIKSSKHTIKKYVKNADILIGAVLLTGARAPILVDKELVASMKEGAVIVDIAIDQGGCIYGSTPTYHSDPTFKKLGKIYYCVANMPGTFPRSSSIALTNSTIEYAQEIANNGVESALKNDRVLRRGLNVYKGKITCKGVADAFNMEYVPPEKVL